jgi:hypothetical protein
MLFVHLFMLCFDQQLALSSSKSPMRVNRRMIVETVSEAIMKLRFLYLSVLELTHASPTHLRQKFSVTFDGEHGVDASGLTKEMFSVLFQALFSGGASSGLFVGECVD